MNELGKSRVAIITESIIIVILIIIIIILSINNNTCNKQKRKILIESQTKTEEDYEENNTPPTITDEEALNIVKQNYNDAIRHILNEKTSYCGTLATEGNTTLDINNYKYQKSSSYNTYEELEKYVKQYATDSFLEKAKFNHQTTVNGQKIISYYQTGGNLYCNTWKEELNPLYSIYSEKESTFEIIKNNKNIFRAKITAIYYNNNKTTKTPIELEVKVVKQKNKWLLDDYNKLS